MEDVYDKNDNRKKRILKLLSDLDLNNSSSHVTYKALTQLRADASQNKSVDKYLCEANAFKILSKYLKLPNDKILTVALSILANSSLNEDCRKQVTLA